MSYSRAYYDPIQIESEQKDLIISQLKAEHYELQQNRSDFSIISQQLNSLELKYAQLQDEQLRIDRDGRSRGDQDLKTIANLRDEIDILKSELQSRQRDSSEFKADNNALKDMIAFRNAELEKLRRETADIQDQAKKLQNDRQNLERILKRLKDDRSQLQGENEVLQNEYEQLYQKQRSYDKGLKDAEFELTKADKLFAQLSKQRENLSLESKHKKDLVDNGEAKAKQNERTLSEYQTELKSLEDLIEQAQSEAREALDKFQNEVARGKELQNKLINLENQIRQKDLSLEDLRMRLDEISIKRGNYLDDNKFLNNEIDRALEIINQLNLIKTELKEEIQLFAEEDQRAIALLSRQDQQREVIHRSETRVSQSLQTISHFINKAK